MLQKLGKKHRLLPAAPLWPGELAHWRARAGLSSPELPVLLLGNIKGLGTALLRQPASLPPLPRPQPHPPSLRTVEEELVEGRGVDLMDALSPHSLAGFTFVWDLAPFGNACSIFFLC